MQIDLTKKWNTRMKQRTLITFDTYYNEQATNTYALSGTALNSRAERPWLHDHGAAQRVEEPGSVQSLRVRLLRQPGLQSGNMVPRRFEIRPILLRQPAQSYGRADGRSPLPDRFRAPRLAEYTVNTTEGAAKKFTYSTGANYRVLDRRLVGYVNVASGFNPSPQFDANTGALLGNLESFGGEAGLKGALMEDRFSYTLAAFNVEQENEVTDNPENPGGTDLSLPRSIPGASTRSRGMSIDVGGKVSSNLTLLANMAWTEVRIVKHATTRPGRHPSDRRRRPCPRAPIHWPRATISGTAPCAACVWV
jgi:hypothetical protein